MSATRILEFSETPVHLHFRNGLVVVERDSLPEVTVPLEDVAVMLISQQQATLTNTLLSELAKVGGVAVFSDSKHMPAGLMLPIVGHCTQQERFQAQSEAPKPLRKQIWRQVVQAKITAQATLLREVRGQDFGLVQMAGRVRSGDSTNLEAQAAHRYWRALFSCEEFRRRQDGGGANAMLNYGYAVLRACVARSICAAGLHPSLGLHHSNRYDAFCLADDLMEPYRPLVDAAVVDIVTRVGLSAEFDRGSKILLLSRLTGRFSDARESRSLFDWLTTVSSALAQAFLGRCGKIDLPEIHYVQARKEPVRVSSHVAHGDVRSAG